jgi:spore germination protein GerM
MLALLVAACGVGPQSEPQVIRRADVPFGLAHQAPTAPTTTAAAAPFTYTVYLLAGDQLQPVAHQTARVPTRVSILRDLAHGPDDDDSAAGLRTLVPPDTAIDRVTVADGMAIVSLGGSGASRVATDRQVLGVAQLVYTATELPGVDRVRFRVEGRLAEVPKGDGSLTSRAVGRADYPNSP